MKAISKQNDLTGLFKKYIQERQLLQSGQNILLAVSGGIDSVVLLRLFCQIQSEYCLRLAVAHIHHGLRGQDADEDEQFVHSLARYSNLPFYSYRADVKTYAKNHGYSIEEAGRKLRFRFFEMIMRRLRFHRMALAHHADDRAETILMNLFRGTGLRGLRGIEPIRDGWIIHPLIFATRHEIEFWAHQHDLKYREDQSNKDKDFLRNRIRWEVLTPVKTIYGSKVVNIISRAGDAVSESESYLQNEVNKAIKKGVLIQKNHEFMLDITGFLRYFTTVQKALLMHAIREVRKRTPFVKYYEIERLMHFIREDQNHSRLEFNDQIEAIRSNRKIIIRKNRTASIVPRQVKLNQWVSVPECGGKIRISLFSGKLQDIQYSNDPYNEYVEIQKHEEAWWIRGWRKGDRFEPLGMKGSKKLHDFFIDHKIPSYRRLSIPLLEYESDIVWIIGYRISQRFRVKPTSKRIVQLEWKVL